jgi:hypothetical protein
LDVTRRCTDPNLSWQEPLSGTPDGRRVIRLHEPTPITHEEHKALVVPEGWWEVRIQREWVGFIPRAWGGRTAARWD